MSDSLQKARDVSAFIETVLAQHDEITSALMRSRIQCEMVKVNERFGRMQGPDGRAMLISPQDMAVNVTELYARREAILQSAHALLGTTDLLGIRFLLSEIGYHVSEIAEATAVAEVIERCQWPVVDRVQKYLEQRAKAEDRELREHELEIIAADVERNEYALCLRDDIGLHQRSLDDLLTTVPFDAGVVDLPKVTSPGSGLLFQ
jgi:hypothetical protein